MKSVDGKNIHGPRRLHRVLDNNKLYNACECKSDDECKNRTPRLVLVTTEIINHHNGRDREKTQEVNANGKTHHEEGENDPAVSAAFCQLIIPCSFISMFPFEHAPKSDCCKK